jgi:hypothetical protein
MSESELESEIDKFYDSGLLVSTADTERVIAFIKNPPLPGLARFVYGLLFDAAVLSLRPEFRNLLGLSAKPAWLIIPVTRWTLRLMRAAIGPESPIEDGAKARLRRIGTIV